MVERNPLGGLDREERVVGWFARVGGAVLVIAWRGGGGDAGGVVLSLAGPRPRGMRRGAASKQAGRQVIRVTSAKKNLVVSRCGI